MSSNLGLVDIRSKYFYILPPILNKKSAATEVSAQKTQTPIVAKPICTNELSLTSRNGICIFIKFSFLVKPLTRKRV